MSTSVIIWTVWSVCAAADVFTVIYFFRLMKKANL
jgi:hypothetical protein